MPKGDASLSPLINQSIDPGIDDAMAILMAFQSPEIEILGLTTLFGNVNTKDATNNALLLCDMAGQPDIPVAGGSPEPLKDYQAMVAQLEHQFRLEDFPIRVFCIEQ